MNPKLAASLIFFAGASVFGADDKKASLDAARTQYRQAVTEHGQKSPQARAARENLRKTRHNFHVDRRQRKSVPPASR